MKKNALLNECFANIPDEISREIDLSFQIVERIHSLLANCNMTQKDLADLLGKSESEVSRWMRGNHNFTLSTIAKIASVLGSDIIQVADRQINGATVVTINYISSSEYNIPSEMLQQRDIIPISRQLTNLYNLKYTKGKAERTS